MRFPCQMFSVVCGLVLVGGLRGEGPVLDRWGDPLPQGAVARLGTARLRHFAPVKAVAFSSDGRILASADNNGPIRLWEAKSGKFLLAFGLESNASHSLAFTANDKSLAAMDNDGTVVLWDIATSTVSRRFPGPKSLPFPVNALAVAPDGKTLAAGKDHAVCVWDLESGKDVRQLEGHGSEILSVAFAPDGTLASAGSHDRTVRLWHPATGKELHKLAATGPIAFSPDGKYLATHRIDGGLSLWEKKTGKLFRELKVPVRTNCSLAFTPDSKALVWVAFKNGTIHFHDLASDSELRQLGGGSWSVYCLAFTPDGKTLASGGHERLIRYWDMNTGQEINPWPGHRWIVSSLALSPDGQTLVSASAESLWHWHLGSHKEIRSWAAAAPVAVSPDGKVLASASGQREDESVRLWDLATGQPLRRCDGHKNLVRYLSFSPDGSMLASASFDKTIGLWDTASGKPIHRLLGHEGTVDAVVFSPSGKVIASAGYDKTVRLWDATAGKEIKRMEGHRGGVRALAFVPDGKIVVSGSYDRTFRSWDVASAKEREPAPRELPSAIAALAMSGDGRLLASATFDGTLLIWERLSNQVVHEFKTPGFPAYSVVFAVDGRTLLSGGTDSSVLIWDVTGRLREGKLPAAQFTEEQLEKLWGELGSSDARIGSGAGWSLVQAAGQSEAWLKSRLRPAAAVDPQRVQRLFADLDSAEFAIRSKATLELEGLGDAIAEKIREALAIQPALEVRRRLERLLEQAEDPGKSPQCLRELRAVGVLEQLGSEEARRILSGLAKGAASARMTREAAEALQRLKKRIS